MPELSGINVLEAVRREGLDVTVIVLTGLEEAEYRKKCLALGARYFCHRQRNLNCGGSIEGSARRCSRGCLKPNDESGCVCVD